MADLTPSGCCTCLCCRADKLSSLVEAMQASQGRVMNAKIDLGTGHTKAQVGRTLQGIVEFIDGALAAVGGVQRD